MKTKIILLFLLSIFPVCEMLAQIPNTFQYQAVVRNDDGSVLSNYPVEIKIKIRRGAAEGTVVYEETHIAATNVSGIVNIKVGAGTNSSNTVLFADIDWASGAYFLETQANRGNGYVNIGVQQLLSVPYAKQARNAGNVYIKSPNGKLWKMVVDNSGAVSAKEVEN